MRIPLKSISIYHSIEQILLDASKAKFGRIITPGNMIANLFHALGSCFSISVFFLVVVLICKMASRKEFHPHSESCG